MSPTSPILIDVTELLHNPIRTGIQRLVREVFNNWPSSSPYQCVRYSSCDGGLIRVPEECLRAAIDYGQQAGGSFEEAKADIAFLGRFDLPATPLALYPTTRVLIPELFFDNDRVFFYKELIAWGIQVSMVVPDFLVWLKPQAFSLHTTLPLMPYLQLLYACRNRAFISEAVRRTFQERILRGPLGDNDIALDLGADGLGVERQTFDPAKKTLLVLGTLDSRKGQDRIYQAFCDRGAASADLRMVFVGRVPVWTSPILADLLANTRPDVELVTDATDARVADEVRRARALVYTSPAEGYGLPPMECLHAGVPVVIHDTLPAMEGKPALGQIRLPDDEPATIRHAIDRLGDDAVVRDLWAEAADFPGVTWRGVAARLEAWVRP